MKSDFHGEIARELANETKKAYRNLSDNDRADIKNMVAHGKPKQVVGIMFGLTARQIEQVVKGD